jgi:hypothetical protein
MKGTRKQAISLRVAAPDLRKLKKLADRLGVPDSNVIHFAVKTAFIEAGSDLCRHLDLDARLQEIINDGVASIDYGTTCAARARSAQRSNSRLPLFEIRRHGLFQ